MKRRLLYLCITVPLLAIVIGSTLAGVISSLSQPAAYAQSNSCTTLGSAVPTNALNPSANCPSSPSGEQYVVNFVSSQKAAIDHCIKDSKCTISGLSNVFVYAKGGVFGSTLTQLTYEPNEEYPGAKTPIPPPPKMFFTGNYSCQGYSVSVLFYISDFSNLERTSYQGEVLLDHIIDSTGNDTNDLANNGGDGYLDQAQIQSSGLPPACQPANLTTASGGGPTLEHTIGVPNFSGLSSAQQASWGLTVANPTTPAPAPTPSPSLSLQCQTGNILGFIPNPLDYIMCGIIQGASSIVQGLDTEINNLLSVGTNGTSDDPNTIFADPSGSCGSSGANTCNAYYAAWQSLRNIALGLLVIVGLIIVISQALGMAILDAYTVRKMLPRVLLATLAITLSWQLMRFAVTLSNDLGYGVSTILSTPFTKIGINITVGWNSLYAGLVGAAGIALLGLAGLMTFVGTAGIAVIVTFLVLILRQIAIIIMVILAPIALIAYVLPNTQRVYKFWWESFSKMLLMFPMIVAFITTGHIFAAVASSQGTDFIHQTIAMIAYFGPYFMVPATFKFSGAMMSTIGGAVNARGDGARGYLSKKRSERAAANFKKARSGQRWDKNFGKFKNPFTGKDTSIGHIANRAAVNALDQDELLPYRLGKQRGDFKGVWGFRKGAANMQDQQDNRAINESMKGYQEIEQAGGMHYEGWRAVTAQYNDFKGRDRNGKLISQRIAEAGFIDAETGAVKVPQTLSDFETLSHILQESDNDKEAKGGDDLSKHAGSLASIKSHPDMEYADTQVMGAIGLAAAGRADPTPLASITNSVSARLGSGVGQRTLMQAERVGTRNRPDLRDGHGIILNRNTGEYESAYSEKNYSSSTAIGSVTSVKGSDWAGAKAEGVTAAAPTLIHVAMGLSGGAGDTRGAQEIADDKLTIEDSITQGITSPYNDAGQKKAWLNVARGAGWDEDRISRLQQQALRQQADLGSGLLGGDPPGAEPPGANPNAAA